MKIKSNVLFGLIVLICSISGFSLLKRMTREIDEWRPSDLYSSSNLSRRSTYSVVSSGAHASYFGAVPTVSSGSSSMFRHGVVSSYAPAVSVSNSQLPIAGTASYSQSPIAYSQRLHTTSSAEFRSFGGGGNVGGVSMSGGSVKSSNSSVVTASGLNVFMPSTSMYAYNTNRSSASDVVSSMSGDIAMTSTQAYAGIGNTTGGGSRGMSGRRDVPSIGSGVGNAYVNILTVICGGSPDYTLTDNELYTKWLVYYSLSGAAPGGWDEFLAWYKTVRTLPDSPIGDVFPLLFIALIFAMRILLKSRKTVKCKLEN